MSYSCVTAVHFPQLLLLFSHHSGAALCTAGTESPRTKPKKPPAQPWCLLPAIRQQFHRHLWLLPPRDCFIITVIQSIFPTLFLINALKQLEAAEEPRCASPELSLLLMGTTDSRTHGHGIPKPQGHPCQPQLTFTQRLTTKLSRYCH